MLTHGFTLDEKGNKMSKSLGQHHRARRVVKQYGADILRLWVAQTDYTGDHRIGPEILKGVADSYRRLRNTMRFVLGNLAGFSDAKKSIPDDMPELGTLGPPPHGRSRPQGPRTGYAAYDFQGVFREVFDFANADLSSFYFDIRKDTLYCDAE